MSTTVSQHEIPAPVLSAMTMPPEALVMRYRQGLGMLDTRCLDGMSDEDLDKPWLSEAGVGLWSIRAVLGHLADTEMLYAGRMRRAIVEDGPVLENFEYEPLIDGGLYGGQPIGGPEGAIITPPAGAFLALIYTMREMMAATLIQLPPEAWGRRALHPWYGELTVAGLLAFACHHLEHHVGFVNAKVEKLLGPRVAPNGEACEPGGCGQQGCGCV